MKPHRRALGVLTITAAALYAACSLARFHTFRAGTYDLVIFDQAIRSYSEFRPPVAIVKGVHSGLGAEFTILGDHWSPILVLLAPFYWIHDGPETLLVAQAVLMALAIPPLWVLSRRMISTKAAYLVACSYALSWPVAEAVLFDFHEAAFAPVITAVMLERFTAFRSRSAPWWHWTIPAIALLGVKEDMGLLVAGFGLCVLALGARCRSRPELFMGGLFTAGGLAAALITSRTLIPLFGGNEDYYWAYSNFGPTAASAGWYAITHPWEIVQTLTQPAVKARTMLWLALTGLFTPLCSPYLLTVLPLLLERMLSDGKFPAWWGTTFHYNAFLVVPLLCAAVDGAARLGRLFGEGPRFGLGWAHVALVTAVVSVPLFAFRPVLTASHWQSGARTEAARVAVSRVPDGALVETANQLGPHLSARTRVLLWDRVPRWAPWVVADTRTRRFQFCDVAEQRARVSLLQGNGYRIVFERDGFVVLHREGPEPVLHKTASPGCRRLCRGAAGGAADEAR